MWKLYRDITGYALLFTLVTLFFGSGIISIIFFGILGTPVGYFAFNYFQKEEFYGYYNLGYTKFHLLSKTWFVNLILSPILVLVFLLLSNLLAFGTPASN
ncbi:hypothetical protein [Leeuwenhoekiella sp. W20_SRS_FM14]|uniref:hypothetical protein n=1 Tax=Leeuwenhoekiella sp. W20_SRS_FM14 TaxID=3240270 RepID=UPI00048B398C